MTVRGQAILLALSVVLVSPLMAGNGTDLKIDAILAGAGIPSAFGVTSKAGTMTETLYLSADRVRVDFASDAHFRGQIYRHGSRAWLLLLQPVQRVLPANGLQLGKLARLNPKQPCFDLEFSCHRVDDRLIAGRHATGWRYRHAERSGPQGTDHGTFWIDSQTGAMLGFKGRSLAEKDYRMHVVAVHVGPLPKDTFELPSAIKQARDAARDKRKVSAQ